MIQKMVRSFVNLKKNYNTYIIPNFSQMIIKGLLS